MQGRSFNFECFYPALITLKHHEFFTPVAVYNYPTLPLLKVSNMSTPMAIQEARGLVTVRVINFKGGFQLNNSLQLLLVLFFDSNELFLETSNTIMVFIAVVFFSCLAAITLQVSFLTVPYKVHVNVFTM